ncbi:MAG: Hsp20/alpha crystallin family protein [Firmicutes bacterium]|jgi:HSP20 family protein|uniref:Heat-shock protein Hsp20 n=1 Tax=Sulfobacillus benefaciens TaxID=453960 RepID=A0A2T2WVH8_9FIRM|nr:Hsp20/alpha crystallin family protein [Bacillota bacterium]MCL5015425.1 Hsp20/alpha crystallin family protein [Bacillota bacterium]PSR26235.1 MAG: heat-shock protein Hsp20 [Sulfobacillus benefaciens]HBQ96823.1 heat-shock protein Hsp20 [Sulfobacillus sp.]
MSLFPMRRNGVRDPLIQLHNDVNEVFDRVFRGWGFPSAIDARSVWEPNLDVDEDDRHYYLHMDMPGVDTQDVSVEVDNGAIIISGEKRDEREKKGRRSYTSERYYGRFYREITLPLDADLEQLKAELKKGVLTVTIPKNASAARRTIPIQGE